MSDAQVIKKKNKKKKKASTENTPTQCPSTQLVKNDTEKETFNITEVLPQQVGMKTVFKDVEVTMTHSGAVNGVSKKKKKKKKKGKQDTVETMESDTPTCETDKQNNFFKFNENHIELLNHPEISVTISKTSEVQSKVSLDEKEKSNSTSGNKESEVPPTTGKSKKKKKKKKKKNTETPTETVPDSEETPNSGPTYVKLPASGDNCVLLVSHESFCNDNKPLNNTTTSNSVGTVLVKSTISEGLKGGPVLEPNQVNSSISISPLSMEQNKIESSEIPETNMESSLQKVSSLGKMEETTVQKSEDGKEEAKSKAQLKAERRAKQEAQRAAKLAKSSDKDTPKIQDQTKVPPLAKPPSLKPKNEFPANKSTLKPLTEKKNPRKMLHFFSHLPQCSDLEQFTDSHFQIHPAVLELGAHYSKGVLFGSNARCVGFLAAFREVIKDYKTQPEKEFARDLESGLQIHLDFLNSCRPLSVSIDNSVRFLKHQINHMPKEMDKEKVKERLCLSINNFVKEEILLAKEAISISATAKIVDGDTILVFAYSSLVKDVLCRAHDQNKSFHVVVVDSRPKLEGLEMLRRLNKHGIRCSYASINTASFVMKTVSKVIIGAHALLSNGCVMSRLGCKQLALIASSYSIPVLVCCETYKFCERALTDSFVHNELGKVDELIQLSLDRNDSLQNFKLLPSLQVFNILYDVTPSGLISVVITEKGLLPCTSVPVVLRVKQAGL